MSGPERARTIRTDVLTRVEGEGALEARVQDGEVTDVRLRIYEPPRFFEAFLRGRSFTEVADLTSRICGICPIAYQISALRAVEDACGVMIDSGPIRLLRRLIYCGEWIASHSLHVYMLHAPDFLGYPGAVEMAREHPEIVERGLAMKKVGNLVMATLGGRAIHPINLRVGGFHRLPTPQELSGLVEPLRRARETALATVDWAAGLPFPDGELSCERVALCDGGDYPIDRGVVALGDRGREVAVADFDACVVEHQVPHSTALHARLREGGTYLTGPLARYDLASPALRPLAREAATNAGLAATCANPSQSIIVRAVELVQATDEALALIEAYEPTDAPAVEVTPRRGVGHGASEAPRGLLYHRYELDDEGTILDARIVPPTSQNQAAIEQDLHGVLQRHLELDDDALRTRCEQTIRNYDPCISCATHFLTLRIDRD